MKWVTKLSIPVVIAAILATGCNNKESEKGRFDDLLAKPPYTSVTDSIREQPQNDQLYFRRGVMLNSNDLPEPALADFRKAWSLKKDEKYAFGLANLLLEKRADSAISFLESALKDLPESYLLKVVLARALNEQGKTDEALALCNNILAKDANSISVLKLKADILDRKGDSVNTIATLRQAYQLAPQDIELNYMLALKYAESKDGRVLALCDSLIKADSLGIHAEPYYYKGIYYSNIHNNEKALAFFDNAIKTDINFLDGYIEKASLLYEQKKYTDAMTVLNLCLTVSPKFADTYYWIGKCQEATGEKENARLNYQRAYSLNNNLVEAKDALERMK